MGKTKTRCVGLVALCLSACVSAPPPVPREFPVVPPTPRQLERRAVADAAFEDGHYGGAFAIYRRELAPAGDKYAQYAVGWMLFNGQGVERDPAEGLAWMMLAGERGDPAIGEALAEARGAVPAGTVARARQRHALLAELYGDCSLLREWVRRERAALGRSLDEAGVAGELTARVGPEPDADGRLMHPRENLGRLREHEAWLARYCQPLGRRDVGDPAPE